MEWDDELYDNLYDEIKSFKAAGTNNIPGEIFTKSPKELKEIWRIILKNCWDENWIPEEWRLTNIILLSKNEMTEFMSYYRPIALAQVEMKLYTNIIYEKLAKYCEENEILEDLQFGSRKGRSAAQALVSFRQVIDDAIENNKELYIMYLDFAKAYDSVEHDMLRRTLMYYKIPEEIIERIMELYKDNKANIFTPHGITENTINIDNGVKQGDTLSPLLFILFINPLLTKLRESKLGYKFGREEKIKIPNITYSDDNTLITSSQEEMHKMTDIVIEFCKETGIRLNPTKCVYTYKNDTESCEPMEIQGHEVKPVTGNQAQRLLGIEFALDQEFEAQQKKTLSQLRIDVWKTEDRFLFTRQKIKIINLMYIPKIAYRMNAIEYDRRNIDKMNKICTNDIKDSMKWPRKSNDHKIWSCNEEGGPGLYNIKMINQKTILGTFLKQGINHEAKYPRELIKAKLEEKQIKIEDIADKGDEGGKSYLEAIARTLKDLHMTIKNKNDTTLRKTEININKGNNIRMYDKIAKKEVAANFTDGSYMPESRKTGVAIVYGVGNTVEWPANYKSKSFSSELEGLERALATTRAQIIFCDCLGAINSIKTWRKKLTKTKCANENRAILKSIDEIIIERRKRGLGIPEIVWTPSHMDEKGKKMTKTMKEQVTYLKERFNLETIIRRNKQVDELAKIAAARDGGTRHMWHTIDQYYMTDEEQIEEKEVNKLIVEIYKRRHSAKAYGNSGWGGLAGVHRAMSNKIFTKNSVFYMKIQQYMWRLRNNCLPNHARQYMKYRNMPKDDSMAIMRALLNNTPECEETKTCRDRGTIADITHMWTCPSNKQLVKEYEDWIDEIMKLLGGRKEDVPRWTLEISDQPELDFSAEEIDQQKAQKAREMRDKRKGGLFECIKERIRLREWNKDSSKRARMRDEREEREIQREAWREKLRIEATRKRKYNFIIDDRQGTRSETPWQGVLRIHKERLIEKRNERMTRMIIEEEDCGEKMAKKRRGEETPAGPTTSGKRKRSNMQRKAKKKARPDWVEKGKKRKRGGKEKTEGKNKQPKITDFITGNTKEIQEEESKKRPRPVTKRKVTRKELLTEVLPITKIQNIEKREESEKKWGQEELRQYTQKKKKTKEKTAAKGRATQGWIMKDTVRVLRKIGRENKIKPEEVDERIITIIGATVKLSYDLHKKSIVNNRKRRQDEGLALQFTKNSRNNYKAIMNMKTKQDSRGIG
jgi:hypothetical protein